MQNAIIPVAVVLVFVTAAVRRVNVFKAFTEGAKDGLLTMVTVFPTLCALFFAVGVFEKSGAQNVLCSFAAPLCHVLSLPKETLPLVILRPMSGSGSIAFFSRLVSKYGADSIISKTAATMVGAGETTFYTVSVYYGAAGVTDTRYTLPCALAGDMTLFACAGFFVSFFFK